MKNPSDYPRRILVAVTGLSPQILTETLYALVKQKHSFIPTEIHVLTTVQGAERIKLQLLSDDPGWLRQLVDELGIPMPEFGYENIHVIQGLDGQALADIRTPQENDFMADMVMKLIQSLTSDRHSAVHASIAGGRKTMGFYLGYAMSLFGREQDSMSHVLVSPEYEGHFDFFYPTSDSRIIYANDPRRTPLDTRNATVQLADIPFIRLRHMIPGDIRAQQKNSYSDFIDKAQAQFPEPELTISVPDRTLIIEGTRIKLSAVLFTWYHLLAKARVEAGENDKGYISIQDDDLGKKFLKLHKLVVKENSGNFARTAEALSSSKGLYADYVQDKTSLIRGKLRKSLLHRAEAYTIITDESEAITSYGIEVKPENIQFIY